MPVHVFTMVTLYFVVELCDNVQLFEGVLNVPGTGDDWWYDSRVKAKYLHSADRKI
jgi:hypothetical protein